MPIFLLRVLTARIASSTISLFWDLMNQNRNSLYLSPAIKLWFNLLIISGLFATKGEFSLEFNNQKENFTIRNDLVEYPEGISLSFLINMRE
jgi:hypothetical protein